MISIVISYYRPKLLSQLIENINSTIGVEHEIVAIENINGEDICKTYNRGISKAKFKIICFIHEDLLIETQNWGNKVQEIFSLDPKIGLVGVAGNKKKTKAPSQTWSREEKDQVINIKHTVNEKHEHLDYGWDNQKLQQVMIIDGVFMCIQNDQNLRFNTEIPGFHFYDMSISLECRINGLKTVVTREILINHFSTGIIDSSWIYPAHVFHKSYNHHLPLGLNRMPTVEEERSNLSGYIIFCVENKFIRISFRYWLNYFMHYPFSGFNKLYFKYLRKYISS